jgi:hypothetical protein
MRGISTQSADSSGAATGQRPTDRAAPPSVSNPVSKEAVQEATRNVRPSPFGAQRTRSCNSGELKISQASTPTVRRVAGFPSLAVSSTSLSPISPAQSPIPLPGGRFRMPVYGPGYWIVLMIPKIGRYMATIIPPTTVPRITIIAGSMAFNRDSTATSTSSS